MNQKGIASLILIGVIAVGVVGGSTAVVASDNAKPGDALYSVDRGSEKVRDALTFRDESKAKAKFEQASERLEELEALQNSNASSELIGEASGNYGQAISEAANALADVASEGGNINEALANLVAEATAVHLDVLSRVYEQVPEQAKGSIEKAMEAGENGAEKSLEAINGQVSKEKRNQAQDKVEESKAKRDSAAQPEDVPAVNGTNNGPGNKPENTGTNPGRGGLY